ncbi:MAG: substrate-binding domain-containing protein [Propionibacteriaceae bacterium]|nr:substrate-binding domain-containing protein [Propionibacteriaceae bacterium]
MKKLFSLLVGVALAVSLVGCSSDDTNPNPTNTTKAETIYVLGPTPDHGWTAQAGAYADAAVKQINNGGQYKAEYLPSSDGEAQNDNVQTIIANGDAAGVVFFALDDSAKAGQEALIGANIPFISFDRIIEGPDKSAILNFSGDNWAVGAGIGYWLQKQGMEPGDVLITLIGDNGTVSSRRQEGFEEFLLGTRDYTDAATAQTYHTTTVWTAEQISTLTAAYKEVCDWSADKAYQYLELKMPDIISDAKAAGDDVYFFSMDDEMTFGVLNLLEGNTLTDAQKTDIENLKFYISAIGGMAELYEVIAGTSPQSALASKYFDDIMSMWFSPKMMQTCIDFMVQYLNKSNWTFAVGAGEYEPTWIVDASNVSQYEGFNGHGA